MYNLISSQRIALCVWIALSLFYKCRIHTVGGHHYFFAVKLSKMLMYLYIGYLIVFCIFYFKTAFAPLLIGLLFMFYYKHGLFFFLNVHTFSPFLTFNLCYFIFSWLYLLIAILFNWWLFINYRILCFCLFDWFKLGLLLALWAFVNSVIDVLSSISSIILLIFKHFLNQDFSLRWSLSFIPFIVSHFRFLLIYLFL